MHLVLFSRYNQLFVKSLCNLPHHLAPLLGVTVYSNFAEIFGVWLSCDICVILNLAVLT